MAPLARPGRVAHWKSGVASRMRTGAKLELPIAVRSIGRPSSVETVFAAVLAGEAIVVRDARIELLNKFR